VYDNKMSPYHTILLNSPGTTYITPEQVNNMDLLWESLI